MTYSVIVEVTKRGKVENYQIKKKIINSKRRFTYDEVQKIIETVKAILKRKYCFLMKLLKS